MKKLVGLLALLSCGPSSLGDDRQDCKDYVWCSYKTGVPVGSLDSSYGASGWCWQTVSTANNCTQACANANAAFKSSGVAADAGCGF
jgi:hypothetical protein